MNSPHLTPAGIKPDSDNSLKDAAFRTFVQYLKHFVDSPTGNIHWMADSELAHLPKKTIRRAAHIGGEGEVASLFEILWEHNCSGMAIYIGVSAPLKPSGTEISSAHMDYPRFFVCDFDCESPEAFAMHAEALTSICGTARKPTTFLVQTSAHKFHAYWKLPFEVQKAIQTAGYVAFTDWSVAQRELANLFSSDLAVHNPDRVFRVPGFKNYKGKASLSDGFTTKLLSLLTF